ncbi:MipA/OmpV family protein [Arenimonas sp. MALMAid1274]|uniref:MipA/OmpV family protein n=1 Tax=Arenimonas sp. MALMAid1274 TaxID=3411630 RepID=UPI003BA138C3
MRNALLFASLLAAAPVLAQEPDAPRWTFGVLAADRDAPYRDLDEDLLVVPLVRFEGEDFYLRGLRGAWRLSRSDRHELALFGQVRTDGYDSKDSDFLTGMDDRRMSLDLGIASTWTSPRFGALELSLAGDALDRSGGFEAAASWNALFRAGGWTFIPGVAVRWQDASLVDYYYGVRNDEAIAGRPAYEADSAVVPDVSLLATRPLSKRWTIFARASHAWLPSEISNSPIVDDDGSTGLMIGLGWSPD